MVYKVGSLDYKM